MRPRGARGQDLEDLLKGGPLEGEPRGPREGSKGRADRGPKEDAKPQGGRRAEGTQGWPGIQEGRRTIRPQVPWERPRAQWTQGYQGAS